MIEIIYPTLTDDATFALVLQGDSIKLVRGFPTSVSEMTEEQKGIVQAFIPNEFVEVELGDDLKAICSHQDLCDVEEIATELQEGGLSPLKWDWIAYEFSHGVFLFHSVRPWTSTEAMEKARLIRDPGNLLGPLLEISFQFDDTTTIRFVQIPDDELSAVTLSVDPSDRHLISSITTRGMTQTISDTTGPRVFNATGNFIGQVFN